MCWREYKLGALVCVTETAETFDDMCRIAEHTGVDAAISDAVTLACEVLERARLPTGAHIRNNRGEYLPLQDDWQQAGLEGILAGLPPAFVTEGMTYAPCASEAFTAPASAERMAVKVLQAQYRLDCTRAEVNLPGVGEWAFRLGHCVHSLQVIVAGWPVAAARGDKEFRDSRKAHPQADARRAILLARDAELKAEGVRPMQRYAIIAGETDQKPGAVKQAVQRARKAGQ